ncbi:hypothetical protein T492DRAFT_887885, partial [Pavlovales sp. CCMP2436]
MALDTAAAAARGAPLLPVLRERAAATAPPEGGAAWLATMMLLFSTRGGGPHAETPLKATKATTTMLLPAAAAVCALAASQCCPLETSLKATKAIRTMLLPAAATAGLRRPGRGRNGAARRVPCGEATAAAAQTLTAEALLGDPGQGAGALPEHPPPGPLHLPPVVSEAPRAERARFVFRAYALLAVLSWLVIAIFVGFRA